ncbi:unnamed protein product [Soboliphyme baturini]|uniref:Aquaporin-3 n=1 Tax=Soboliphyme baturini TaxID=241478 RepID=A0A183J1B6_9BILA|nr:unnamed protein product [Soboliphyme baturini]
MLAELLGTVLLALGDGAIAQMVLSRGQAGSFLSVNLAYGFAVAFGVYVCCGVSGTAILALMSGRLFPYYFTKWSFLPFYWIGQYIGGFCGAVIVYFVYKGTSYMVTGPNATANIFATYPAAYLSTGGGLLDQIVGTAVLLACVLAILDQRNTQVPTYFAPLLIGFVIMVLGMSYGFNSGYALNPARDLGPRLFTLMVRWGSESFTAFRYWFWVPIIGPHIGALVGSLIYIAFVQLHWPRGEPQLLEAIEIKSPLRGHY